MPQPVHVIIASAWSNTLVALHLSHVQSVESWHRMPALRLGWASFTKE